MEHEKGDSAFKFIGQEISAEKKRVLLDALVRLESQKIKIQEELEELGQESKKVGISRLDNVRLDREIQRKKESTREISQQQFDSARTYNLGLKEFKDLMSEVRTTLSDETKDQKNNS